MAEFMSLARFLHLLPVVFMAAPLYMLIIVNERAGFGPGIDYKLDNYMENIISKQPKRCYIFLLTVLASGLAILLWGAPGIASLVTNWVLTSKLVLFLALVSLLSYVHLGIQPRINALLAQVKPEGMPAEELGPRIWALRKRRKKLSCVCLFLVISTIVLGVRLTIAFHATILALFIVLAGLFSIRCFRTLIPYGWA